MEDEDQYLYGDQPLPPAVSQPIALAESEMLNLPESQQAAAADAKDAGAVDEAGNVEEEGEGEEEEESESDQDEILPPERLTGKPNELQRTKPATAGPAAPAQPKIDMKAEGQINGVSVYEFSIDTMEDRPWLKPGADISDYFNYGFDETSWREYCDRQKALRVEASNKTKIAVYPGPPPMPFMNQPRPPDGPEGMFPPMRPPLPPFQQNFRPGPGMYGRPMLRPDSWMPPGMNFHPGMRPMNEMDFPFREGGRMFQEPPFRGMPPQMFRGPPGPMPGDYGSPPHGDADFGDHDRFKREDDDRESRRDRSRDRHDRHHSRGRDEGRDDYRDERDAPRDRGRDDPSRGREDPAREKERKERRSEDKDRWSEDKEKRERDDKEKRERDDKEKRERDDKEKRERDDKEKRGDERERRSEDARDIKDDRRSDRDDERRGSRSDSKSKRSRKS